MSSPESWARRKALRLVLPYLILATLWIVGSDSLVLLLLPGGSLPQTIKGIGFVLITSLFLYLLLLPTFRDLQLRISREREQCKGRERAERALRDSLEVQTALVQELHHRVKNNLQVLNSLISLQMAASRDEERRQLLRRVVERIRSISVVEEELYRLKQLHAIDLSPVITNLVAYLDPGEHPVRPQILQQIDDVRVPLSDAVPIAIITQELMTNAISHAFDERTLETAVVNIALTRSESGYQLLVRDNGRGIEGEALSPTRGTMGFAIIYTLVEQLDAELTYQNQDGSLFTLTVPISPPERYNRVTPAV
ncbi:MAG: sensor histidine kinase [Spirochaetaceae bacterium]